MPLRQFSTAWKILPESFVAFVLACGGIGHTFAADPCPPCPQNCPPGCPPAATKPKEPYDSSQTPTPATPGMTDPNAVFNQNNAADPVVNQNMNNQGFQSTASSSQAAAPNMIGDLFGGPYLALPSPSGGGGLVGRVKLAENGSPIPQDRVAINYSFFDNTTLTQEGVDVHRVTPMFEKTFGDGWWSVEFRTPFASTLSSDITSGTAGTADHGEFGNLSIYLKHLIYRSQTTAVSTGFGVTVPTADDIVLRSAGGIESVRIKNESVHLLPYIGGLYNPNQQFFMQGFAQLDIDTNGNTVQETDFINGGYRRAGNINDATFLYLSGSMGYWVYRDQCKQSGLSGLAPMLELHINQSLQGSDYVVGNLVQVGLPAKNVNVTNAVLGLSSTFGQNKSLTAGYVVPLGGGSDQQFDGEFRLMFNWYFGRSAGANPYSIGY